MELTILEKVDGKWVPITDEVVLAKLKDMRSSSPRNAEMDENYEIFSKERELTRVVVIDGTAICLFQ